MVLIQSTPLQKMKDFIGHLKVKTLRELIKSNDTGVFVVLASFVYVEEGVDAWFHHRGVKPKLKFRLKLKVEDDQDFAIFSLYDSDVELLAMETCPVLHSMGESCSLFPDEMDCYFGDSILYKVQRDCSVLDEKIPHFKVISICNEVAVVDKFIDAYLSSDENIDPVTGVPNCVPIVVQSSASSERKTPVQLDGSISSHAGILHAKCENFGVHSSNTESTLSGKELQLSSSHGGLIRSTSHDIGVV
ncbi:hypothetical protein QL285_001692 [Trifolium repens]|nr:hypothetical protein QL285_001692 [Trifolium repens]